jgi:hypothetical protein
VSDSLPVCKTAVVMFMGGPGSGASGGRCYSLWGAGAQMTPVEKISGLSLRLGTKYWTEM